MMNVKQFREDLTSYQRRAFRLIARGDARMLPGHRAKVGTTVIGDSTLCVLINNGLIRQSGDRMVATDLRQ